MKPLSYIVILIVNIVAYVVLELLNLLCILFGCPELGATRYCLPNNITEAMPDGMRDSFSEMIVENKLIFLLSAMHCCYTKDWGNLYRSIVIFVDKMYSERSAKYKALEMS